MGLFRYRIPPFLLALLLSGLYSSLYGMELPSGRQDFSAAGASVRERLLVAVGSGTEEWRLEWHAPPKPACDPSGEDWYTCLCDGFAFGEAGQLDLVRHVRGMPEERLCLSPLFTAGYDGDAIAMLPRWPVHEGDFEQMGLPGFGKMVRSRPVVRIMELADYDHDGRATEFLLQTGAGPCGHRQTVLVGISRKNPKLHVFGTLARPNIPLVLESPDAWMQFLRSKGKTTVISWPCGDHGSEEERTMELVAEASGIRAFLVRYTCVEEGRSRLVLRTEQ